MESRNTHAAHLGASTTTSIERRSWRAPPPCPSPNHMLLHPAPWTLFRCEGMTSSQSNPSNPSSQKPQDQQTPIRSGFRAAARSCCERANEADLGPGLDRLTGPCQAMPGGTDGHSGRWRVSSGLRWLSCQASGQPAPKCIAFAALPAHLAL